MKFCDKSSHGKKKKYTGMLLITTEQIHIKYIWDIYVYCVAAQLHIHYYVYIISCSSYI